MPDAVASPLALRRRVRSAADVLCRYPLTTWHYGDSIGFEGLLAATDLLGDGRYEGFVHGAVKAWIGGGRPYRELDNTAPGSAMCSLYERTGDEAIVEAARQLVDYLRERRTLAGAYISFERAPLRRPYGGGRLDAAEEKLLADPGAGVFVDTLHFDAPFFVHLGVVTSSRELLDAGAAQAAALVGLLQQEDGLFAHFYLERTQRTYGHGWGRGQGWALLGLVEVLDRLPSDHSAYPRLHAALTRLARRLADSQASDGHWPTPIEDRTSFHETSTALFVAAGFTRGIRSGLLDSALATTADRAWRAGLGAVAADGTMVGVSAALWAATLQSHYGAAPVDHQVPWGQGPFLAAAWEYVGRPLDEES